MSGHSHWANIKHYKGAADAKRGKVWSKLSRLIIIASKAGGGDPITNLKLRYAIDKARAISMPKDNIERAIRRGTGEAEGITFEELVYEGFGSGGTAIVVIFSPTIATAAMAKSERFLKKAEATWVRLVALPTPSTAKVYLSSLQKELMKTA